MIVGRDRQVRGETREPRTVQLDELAGPSASAEASMKARHRNVVGTLTKTSNGKSSTASSNALASATNVTMSFRIALF